MTLPEEFRVGPLQLDSRFDCGISPPISQPVRAASPGQNTKPFRFSHLQWLHKVLFKVVKNPLQQALRDVFLPHFRSFFRSSCGELDSPCNSGEWARFGSPRRRATSIPFRR